MNRADNNQEQIIKVLRSCGISVAVTSQVGGGFPDLVCGCFGKNYLLEIKNPESKGKLSTEQLIFRDKWKGKIHVVNTVEEALQIFGVNV